MNNLTGEYKYPTAWHWVYDYADRIETLWEARVFIRRLADCVDDPEAIIEVFGDEMEEDGYFEEGS